MCVRILDLSPSLQIASQSRSRTRRLAICTHGDRPRRTLAGLLRRRGARELDVLYTKGIEGLGDGDFGLGVKERVGELLALWQMAG